VDDDKTAAIADLKEALKRNPDYPQARETLRDLQNETRWALW
jgi:hypothetical protein